MSGDDDLRELTYRTVGNLETTATTSAIVWSQLGSLGSASGISSVIYAAGRLIAGTSDGHIFTSDDSGATWTDRGQIASETDIPIVFDSQYSGQLLAIGASGNTYRSQNNGTSWNSGIVYMAWAADAPFLRGGTDYGGSDPYYYVMAIGANVYRYAGFLPPSALASWTNIGALGAETSAPSALKVSASILLMGTSPNGKVFRSTDNGVTWGDLGQLGAETSVVCMAINGATVVAGTSPNGKIYRSTDSGATWGLAASLASAFIVSCLLYTGGSTFVAGTGANGKIYRSTDDGVNWSEIGDLTENQITALINIGNGLAFTDGSQWAYDNEIVYTEANATHAEAVDILELVAPAGWSFAADASPTNDSIYIQFSGET